MSHPETLQFQAMPGLRKKLEAEASRLNLMLRTYIMHMDVRLTLDRHAARLARHVREVFGQHGETAATIAEARAAIPLIAHIESRIVEDDMGHEW